MFYRSFCLGLSVEFKVQNDFIMSAGLRLLPLVQILEEMASLLHHDVNEGGILISLVEITHNDGVYRLARWKSSQPASKRFGDGKNVDRA